MNSSHSIFITAAVIAVCMQGLGKVDGLRREVGAPARRVSETSDIHEVYYSEALSENDTPVTVLDAGGFKLTASCKTVTYNYERYQGIPSSSTFTSSSTPSSYRQERQAGGPGYYSSIGSTPSSDDSGGRGGRGGSRGGGGDDGRGHGGRDGERGREMNDDTAYYSMYFDDEHDDDADYSMYYYYEHDDDDSWEFGSHPGFYGSYDFSHTQSFAALELTYTASDGDYVYGVPSHSYSYPDEETVAGWYEPGESRTQTVFAGTHGGGGWNSCTMQSMSGSYVSINGDSTVGIHRQLVDGMGEIEEVDGSRSSSGTFPVGFPEGLDCMIAGVITYVDN